MLTINIYTRRILFISMTLVSIVIPTYNRSEYLRGAIDTALSQTYSNIEVVVVDDGSDKAYAEDIVRPYSDDVRLVQHEVNKGLSAARNTGIEESNGDYIAFLDDDDRWHETKIRRQVTALNKNEGAGLATCLVISISPNNDIIHAESYVPSGDCLDELLVSNTIGTPSRVMVRRSAIEQIGGFDEELPTKQDWDFYLRLAQQYSIVSIEDYLCFRTAHESMSSSVSALKRDKHAILEKHRKRLEDKNLWDKAKADVSTEIGRLYLRSGELQNARKYLRDAISLDPSIQRTAMLSLTYTTPFIVQNVISIKRAASYKQPTQNPQIPIKQITGIE